MDAEAVLNKKEVTVTVAQQSIRLLCASQWYIETKLNKGSNGCSQSAIVQIIALRLHKQKRTY